MIQILDIINSRRVVCALPTFLYLEESALSFGEQEDDPPGRLYKRMGRNGKGGLCGVFVEDVGGGIVAEFKIDFLFSRVFERIEIRIQNAIPESVGAWLAVIRSQGRGQLVDFHEPLQEK